MTATVAIDVGAHCARRDRNCCGGSVNWTGTKCAENLRENTRLSQNGYGMRSLAGGRCVMMMMIFFLRTTLSMTGDSGVATTESQSGPTPSQNPMGSDATATPLVLVVGTVPGVFVRMPTPNRIDCEHRPIADLDVVHAAAQVHLV